MAAPWTTSPAASRASPKPGRTAAAQAAPGSTLALTKIIASTEARKMGTRQRDYTTRDTRKHSTR